MESPTKIAEDLSSGAIFKWIWNVPSLSSWYDTPLDIYFLENCNESDVHALLKLSFIFSDPCKWDDMRVRQLSSVDSSELDAFKTNQSVSISISSTNTNTYPSSM